MPGWRKRGCAVGFGVGDDATSLASVDFASVKEFNTGSGVKALVNVSI